MTRALLLIFVLLINLTLSTETDGLPVADFLESPIVEDDQLSSLEESEPNFESLESLPLLLSDSDLAKESDAVIQEDELGSSPILKEIHEQDKLPNQSTDLDKSAEDYEATVILSNSLNEKSGLNGGTLEIYNVDDFDERFDDESK